jgi:hypothetical protein
MVSRVLPPLKHPRWLVRFKVLSRLLARLPWYRECYVRLYLRTLVRHRLLLTDHIDSKELPLNILSILSSSLLDIKPFNELGNLDRELLEITPENLKACSRLERRRPSGPWLSGPRECLQHRSRYRVLAPHRLIVWPRYDQLPSGENATEWTLAEWPECL